MKQQYIISVTSSILDALKALDGKSHDSQTIFIVDETERMVGTLTDGDIRRGLIAGATLDAPVSEIMHTNFKAMREGQIDAKLLKEYRENQIYFVPVLDDKGHIVKVCNLIKYYSFLPVDAVLMAGGKGERLRPLTEKTPKPLLMVGDKPIIDHNVDRLISYGVEHINVTVNYLKEQIERHFEEPRGNVKVNCWEEPKYLGTLGSIKFVDHFYNDTVLIMNSDVYSNINFEEFYMHFKENDADMSIAAVPYTVSVPYGILDIESDKVNGVLEKPSYNYYANTGVYLVKRDLINFIPDNEFYNATDFIELLIKNNKKVVRFPLNGTWIDIGSIQEYKRANELAKHNETK